VRRGEVREGPCEQHTNSNGEVQVTGNSSTCGWRILFRASRSQLGARLSFPLFPAITKITNHLDRWKATMNTISLF